MNSIQYISHDVKTEDKQYVTGINCSLKTAYDEMTATKRNFGKESGILAFHAIQAFMQEKLHRKKHIKLESSWQTNYGVTALK